MTPIAHVRAAALLFVFVATVSGCAAPVVPAPAPAPARHEVDLIIRNGEIYDGRGGEPVRQNLAVDEGRVVAIGALDGYEAAQTVDARGLAVAPGFINVLSWAGDSLIHDGRGLSDLKQGVTLELFGEGDSYGPLNDASRQELIDTQTDIKYDVNWTTLGEFLDRLVARGVSPNVASFVGAATVRVHELGFGKPCADAGRARADAGRRAAGNARRRARRRQRADLCTRRVRKDRRADRAGRGCRGVRRCVHFPHPERG
jgi:N-acyl-D-amino-acid deacylase